jgi:hypothetical protein
MLGMTARQIQAEEEKRMQQDPMPAEQGHGHLKK